MTQDKSTPRPWKLTEDGDDHIIRGADDATVHHDTQYYPSGMSIADARFIVQAVNSHDAMQECVEALKEYVQAWEALPGGFHSKEQMQVWLVERMKPAVDGARSALAKLEKANG